MQGLVPIAGVYAIVAAHLIRVMVAPLAEDASYLEPRVHVGLVPVRPQGAAEDLVGVDVPILHPLHPVYAAVPVLECLVDVAPLVVVVVHVGIHLARDVSYWTCEQALCYVRAHVVEVVLVIVNSA